MVETGRGSIHTRFRRLLMLGLAAVMTAVPPGGARWAAAAPAAAEATLRVVDDETGEPIPGASVQRLVDLPDGRSWMYEPLDAGKGPAEFLYRGPPGLVRFQVVAPGHIPLEGRTGAALEVPSKGPFEHVFRLAPAGSVRVTFHGLAAGVPPESIMLHREGRPRTGGWSAHSLRLEGAVASMDGVPPGDYALEVAVGRGYERLPRRAVTVRAGETAEIEIELVRLDPAAAAASAVRGTVTFHAGWGSLESEVRFRGIDGGNRSVEEKVKLGRVKGGAPVPFSFGPLPPGRYLVEVRPQWSEVVEVPEGGGAFDFAVPEPAVVDLRVVAAESGKPLAGGRVWWYSNSGSHRNGLSYAGENADPGPRPGEYRLLVPPGSLQVSARAPGRVETLLEEKDGEGIAGPPVLRSGERVKKVLRLPEAGGVKVLLKCDGRLLEGEGVEVSIVRRGPGGGWVNTVTWGMNGTGGSRERDGIPPGRLTLEFSDPRGVFEPVPDREIVVRPGETTEVTQEFVRRE